MPNPKIENAENPKVEFGRKRQGFKRKFENTVFGVE